MSHIRAIEDEVKGEGERLGPVLLVGGDEMIGSQLDRRFLLTGRVGERPDFGAQSFRPEEAKVAQAADAKDGHFLARSGACTDKRRVRGEAGAHHGCCVRRRQSIWDLEDELFMDSRVAGKAALGKDLVALAVLHGLLAAPLILFVRGHVRIHLLWTVVLVVALALRTLHAGLHLSADTDTVTGFDQRYFGADAEDLADDLVADAEGCGRQFAPAARDSVDVGATDSATFVHDINIVIFEGLCWKLWGFVIKASIYLIGLHLPSSSILQEMHVKNTRRTLDFEKSLQFLVDEMVNPSMFSGTLVDISTASDFDWRLVWALYDVSVRGRDASSWRYSRNS